eukprot:scaffold13173_cov35-Tisochrysis_lutea.AAC.3
MPPPISKLSCTDGCIACPRCKLYAGPPCTPPRHSSPSMVLACYCQPRAVQIGCSHGLRRRERLFLTDLDMHGLRARRGREDRARSLPVGRG